MTDNSKLRAVILTGSRNRNYPMLRGTGLQSKVLLPVNGKPMIARVLETVSASKYQPELYVSTDDPDIEALRGQYDFTALPAESKAVHSFIRSLERIPGNGRVLFVSGDHPLLTPEMVDYFVDEAMRRDLTGAAAMINGTLVDKKYPESRRTYFPVKGGRYSGGNMYLVDKERFFGNTAVLDLIDTNRKNPIKSALSVLGPIGFLLVLFRMIDIHEVARRASKQIGCETGIVEMPFAECCMDVDKESDRVIAEEILAQREQRTDDPRSIPVAV